VITCTSQRDVCKLVHAARLDVKIDYRKENLIKIGKIFSVVCHIIQQAHEMHIYLKRFDDDWATTDLMKQYMRNHCKYLARESKKLQRDALLIDDVEKEIDEDQGSGGEGDE
jgi:hypothetical protein